MNKSEFIQMLSSKLKSELNIPKEKTAKILSTVLECIIQSMKRNDALKFIGFGTFKKRQVKASETTIPSGKVVKVPSYKKIAFSIGKKFKEVVNKK